MLDKFLEHNIQKKLHIFSFLQLKKCSSLKALSENVNISPVSVLTLIDELNFDLQGICKIVKISHEYVIDLCEGVTLLEIYHAIYQESNVLKCLKFMINNDQNVSFSEFSECHYLTRPSAYRIRQCCIQYLNQIGLDVQKNKVVGKEYRIRFLIALLYYKYGIDCCGIDGDSIQLARNFIVATNNKINLRFLEYTESEYGYFECLLILSWKRKDHPITFQSDELEQLKAIFAYPLIRDGLKRILETTLNLSFSENDYNYIFLAYCCTNNCVLSDQWTEEEINFVHSIVFSNPKFSSIINHFEKNGFSLVCHTPAFHSMLIYFFKKCFFNLHCIIPDKHFYCEIKEDPWKTLILKHLTKTLDEWKKENQIPYPIDDGHLQYLTIQIASIALQYLDPVPVVIVSDLTVELEILKLYLLRAYSNQRLQIRCILFNAEDLSFMTSLTNTVIILKKVFSPALSSLGIPKSNYIVPINIEINEIDRSAIAQAILNCEHKIFERVIPKEI